MQSERESNIFPDSASLSNDGESSGQSDQYDHPRQVSTRHRRHRRSKHDSADPNELDLLMLTDQIEALKRDLELERRQRQEELKLAHRAIQRVYNDCTSINGRERDRLATVEQKVDTVTGRYKGCHDDLKSLKKQVENIMSTAATLRSRIEEIERQPRETTTHAPPQKQTSNQPQSQSQSQSQAQTRLRLDDVNVNEPLPASTSKSRKDFWTAQIIFVLNAARPNIFEVDGVAYLKLQSRSSRQKVVFSSESSLSFVLGIEGSFSNVLRNRTWMPLGSHRLSDNGGSARITLDRLPVRQRESDLWDRDFLEKHCVTYDAAGKAHIYIALQNSELTLRELNGNPPQRVESRNATGKQPTSIPASALMSPLLSPNLSGRVSIDGTRPGLDALGPGRSQTLQALPLAAMAKTYADTDRPAQQKQQYNNGTRAGGATTPSKPFLNWSMTSKSKPPMERQRSSGANTALGLMTGGGSRKGRKEKEQMDVKKDKQSERGMLSNWFRRAPSKMDVHG